MDVRMFPVIDPVATGENIVRLRKQRGLTVRDLQHWFGFEEPQAIYKWQKGKSLPTVDNLYALGALLDVPMEEILVASTPQLNLVVDGQQAGACCPSHMSDRFGYGRRIRSRQPFCCATECLRQIHKVADVSAGEHGMTVCRNDPVRDDPNLLTLCHTFQELFSIMKVDRSTCLFQSNEELDRFHGSGSGRTGQ